MKLFNAIAAAAVIGASFINPAPVEARNEWIEAGCGTDSDNQRGCIYYRVIKRNTPFVTVETKTTYPDNGPRHLTIHQEIDCNSWRIRSRWQWADTGWDPWDPWDDIIPGTIADRGAKAVC